MEAKTSRKTRIKKILIAYAFLLPAIILFFTFDYLPTISAFYYSFTEYNVLLPSNFTGLENYRLVMQDELFRQSLKNSFTYFLYVVPFLITLPLLLAIMVNQKLKGIIVFRVIYYLPVITAMVAVSILWQFLYHPSGLFNSILDMLGLKSDTNWLLNVKTALPAISVLEVWKSMGFYMIIYLAGLQNVSKDLIEAAKIDGATANRILWHVYLPHLRPIIAVTLILSTIATVQIFTSVYMMTGGGPLDSTISLPLYIYKRAFEQLDMGYATAMGMVLWVILMILTVINFKMTRGEKANT